MLQKIVNGIAIASGVVSITVVGVVGVVYFNKDAIIEKVKTEALKQVTGSLGEGLVPSLPSPSVDAPVGEGFGIPNF